MTEARCSESDPRHRVLKLPTRRHWLAMLPAPSLATFVKLGVDGFVLHLSPRPTTITRLHRPGLLSSSSLRAASPLPRSVHGDNIGSTSVAYLARLLGEDGLYRSRGLAQFCSISSCSFLAVYDIRLGHGHGNGQVIRMYETKRPKETEASWTNRFLTNVVAIAAKCNLWEGKSVFGWWTNQKSLTTFII